MKELNNNHYSDKGGHFERTVFHKAIKKIQATESTVPSKGEVWLIRRDMLRNPRTGKK